MARRVSIGELKARCGRLLDECNREGEPCVVTRRGKPIGVLVPWGDDGSPAVSQEQRPESPDGNVARLAEPVAEPSDEDAAMDSATWGQWSEMSDEDRAAMVLAESLIRGSRRSDGALPREPAAGWGALAGRD